MPIAAPLLIGGASIATGLIGANAADKASQRQYDSAMAGLQAQNEARAKLDPYINVGTGATYSLGSLYGIGKDGQTGGQQDFSGFTNSPDFQFAQEQGNLALDRANNAKGLNLSGGALKDAAQFNQGLATQQFGNYYNRLLSLSQIGQNAAGAGVGAANSAANTIQGAGQAQAAGIVGGANALTGGINSGISNSLLYNAINRSSYASPGSTGAGSSPLSLNAGNYGGTGSFFGGLS